MWPLTLGRPPSQIHRSERNATAKKNLLQLTGDRPEPGEICKDSALRPGARGEEMSSDVSLGPIALSRPHTDWQIFWRHFCFKAGRKKEEGIQGSEEEGNATGT